MGDEQRAFVVREKTRRLVVARLAPRRVAVLGDEARRIRRCRFDLAHMVQHALDQPQIAHALRTPDVELRDELFDHRPLHRLQRRALRGQPLEKVSPLRAINIRR